MSEDVTKEMKAEKKSLVDTILDGIITDIIEGVYNPGDLIPPEMELCKKYGAGRNSVREAVKKLEAYGILSVKRGDGTYISETYNQKMLDPMLYNIILQKNSWKDFVELRSVIDIGTLHVLMTRESIGDLISSLYVLLGEMEGEMHKETPSVDRIMEIDTRFHASLAEETENPQLVTITEYITRLTLPSRKKTVKEVLKKGDVNGFIQLHRQIIEIVEKRQVDKIVDAVSDHYIYWK